MRLLQNTLSYPKNVSRSTKTFQRGWPLGGVHSPLTKHHLSPVSVNPAFSFSNQTFGSVLRRSKVIKK